MRSINIELKALQKTNNKNYFAIIVHNDSKNRRNKQSNIEIGVYSEDCAENLAKALAEVIDGNVCYT